MPGKFEIYFGGLPIVETVDDTGCELWLEVPTGAGMLGRSVATVEREGADGLLRTGSRLASRVLQVPFTLRTGRAVSMETMRALFDSETVMTGVLNRPGLHEIKLSHLDGYFLGELSALDVSTRREHFLKGTIEFVCPSPFLYGVERTVSPSGDRVQVESNYFVEPVILWTTSANSGAPRIEVDGKRLTIDTQVSAGQQIRIDSARKETRIGGVLNVENIHGVYPQVYDWSTITTSPGGTVQVQYQERWV